MTAEEFEAKTAASLHVTVEEHRSTGRIAIPCHGCDYEKCEGWQWTSHERLDDKRRDHELGVGPSLNEDEQRAWDEIHSKPWNEAQTKRAIAHADERARAEAKVRRNDDRSVGDRIVDALNEVLEEDASARERERQESERGKKPTSPAIQRLMDEVRNDEPTNVGCFDRGHNRHNRS